MGVRYGSHRCTTSTSSASANALVDVISHHDDRFLVSEAS